LVERLVEHAVEHDGGKLVVFAGLRAKAHAV
jgi:hypothetical protein